MIWTLTILGSVKQILLYILSIFIPKILVSLLITGGGEWEDKFCDCSFGFFCCKGKGRRYVSLQSSCNNVH